MSSSRDDSDASLSCPRAAALERSVSKSTPSPWSSLDIKSSNTGLNASASVSVAGAGSENVGIYDLAVRKILEETLIINY